MENKKNLISRRRFLGSAAAMAGLVVLPGMVTSCKGRGSQTATEDDGLITLGFIGLGQQAMFLLNGFMEIPGTNIVAGCDVYGIKRQRFINRVTDFYKKQDKEAKVEVYENFEDLIKREDIDVVVIAVPDHSHARIAIAACKAGKDVYLEKPLTFTIKEGQELVKAVRDNNRILGVGSQQRSSPEFQHAVKLVQDGTLGKITMVYAYVGAPPKPYDLPEETLPADLNWDLWLGSLNTPIHYNHELNPPISLDPPQNEQIWGAWRWYKEMGGGFTTDWGAHMFDVVQWALGKDRSGPVEISPIGTEFIKYVFADGVTMSSEPFDEAKTKGVKFIGENGWIEVSRGYFKASDPKFMPPEEALKQDPNVPYETRIPHQINFIDAVKNHVDPVVPVEVGHSSCTMCTLGNIAVFLNRTIKWDPDNQVFVDDTDGEATKMLHYEYRQGYSLT